MRSIPTPAGMVRVPIGPPKRDPRQSQVAGTEHCWDAPKEKPSQPNDAQPPRVARKVLRGFIPKSEGLESPKGYCRLGDIECACDGFGPDDKDLKRAACPNWLEQS